MMRHRGRHVADRLEEERRRAEHDTYLDEDGDVFWLTTTGETDRVPAEKEGEVKAEREAPA